MIDLLRPHVPGLIAGVALVLVLYPHPSHQTVKKESHTASTGTVKRQGKVKVRTVTQTTPEGLKTVIHEATHVLPSERVTEQQVRTSETVTAGPLPRYSLGLSMNPLRGEDWRQYNLEVGVRTVGPIWLTGAVGGLGASVGFRVEF